MKEKITKVLAFLGFETKAKNKELTREDWDRIASSYKEQFGSDFYEDMQAAQTQAEEAAATARRAQAHDAAFALLSEVPGATIEEKVKTIVDENTMLKADTERDDPAEIKLEIKPGTFGSAHSVTHIFGIEKAYYDRSKRYNQIPVNGRLLDEAPTPDDSAVFERDFLSFSKIVADRYNELTRSGKIVNGKLDVDYSQLTHAGLGDQYMIRRVDAIIARIVAIPDVTGFFPRRSGIQDRELITNAIFGEFSAAYQEGEVFKGSFKLQPEIGYVDDSMMKTKIGSFKWIERTFLGYWNTNGSDPFKMNQIEWLYSNIAVALKNEQNMRNILGYYIKPKAGEPGSYLNAGNGVVHTLIRYTEELKLLPISNKELADYNATNMIDVVEEYLRVLSEIMPTLNGYELLLNANHKAMFTASYRKKYGKDLDFTGNTISVPDYSQVNIRFVPNLLNLKLMLLQEPGNLQLLEFISGEMYKVYFERRFEELLAMSTWKEGCSASHAGIQFPSLEELKANNYQYQQIFMNKPAVYLEDKATGIDLSKSIWFVTSDNTAATALDGAKLVKYTPGLVFKIECGGTTNATKITNGGKFGLTADWTPAKVGDWIKLVYDENSKKFIEVARSV